jgi:uncharacterized membrane protein YdfJ with MMPL/SSD domain
VPPERDEEVTELVIVRSEELTVDDPAFEAKVLELANELRRPDLIVQHGFAPGLRPTVSADRHAAVLTLGLLGEGEEQAADVVEAVEAAEEPRFQIEVSGEETVERDFNTLSQDDLKTGELQFGLPVALIVLLLVFGAVVAGLVPMALALISIGVALGIVAVVSQFTDLSIFTVNMLSGMGLALGVDYALFVVSRFREERAGGLAKREAIDATGSSASRAVLFSGVAFVLAMFGLLLVPDTIFRSLATGAIVVGAVSVVAALTLLPALLSLLGDRINALPLPIIGRTAQEGTGREGRFWSGIVRAVMRYPVVTLVLSAALLLALAAPVVDLRHGFVGIQTLPERFPSKQGFDALNESFGIGTTDSVQVVVDGGKEQTLPAASRLARDLADEPKLRRIRSEHYRELIVVEALLRGDSQDEAAYDTVERIRTEHVPNRF